MYHMVQKISVYATTATPAHVLFRLLKDPVTWTSWSPMDESGPIDPATDDPNGVGSTRMFRNGQVRGIDRVVELIPARRFGYEHLQGLPLRDYRGNVDLEPTPDGTRIHWHVSFRPKVAGTGWFWRIGLRRFLQQMADGLAAYAAADHPADASPGNFG
jgi:hypothetical protein